MVVLYIFCYKVNYTNFNGSVFLMATLCTMKNFVISGGGTAGEH